MPLSKSAVNRAGESLVTAYNSGDELPLDACEHVAAWRELHAEPLVWLTISVRGRTDTPVSYRLKRLPQIVAKLARAGRTWPSRGCKTSVDVVSW
jgi:hypothetical protein